MVKKILKYVGGKYYYILRDFCFGKIINPLVTKINIHNGILISTKIDTSCKNQLIYIGGEYGGYYIVDCLNESSIVYSCGIGEDVSFDMGIMERYDANVWAFDPSEMAVQFLKDRDMGEKFHFYRYAVSEEDKQLKLYLYEKGKHHSDGSSSKVKRKEAIGEIVVPSKCIQSIMKELGHSKIDLLKLDIEGAEYDVLPRILDLNIKQIAVEFHGRFVPGAKEKNRDIMKELKEAGYMPVYNNMKPLSQEMTFLKNR